MNKYIQVKKTNRDTLIWLNKFFKPVKHPFNMEKNGEKSYSQWEFEQGAKTVKMYTDSCCCGSEKMLFSDKNVLDIGAGAGGKSLYYLTRGARKVTAVDIVDRYKVQAEDFAEKLRLSKKFEYIVGDATNLKFEDNTFDLVVMNDAMEHVNPPEKVISEVKRVLKKGGKLLVNFPPYGHPYGAHLSDVIYIPWVHLFFNDDTLIDAYKYLTNELEDGEMRQGFRISSNNGKEYFSYINKLTIKKFKEIISKSGMNKIYYHETPLKNVLMPIAVLPVIKELFVKNIVCILEK